MKRDKGEPKLRAVALRSQLPHGPGEDKITGKLSVEGPTRLFKIRHCGWSTVYDFVLCMAGGASSMRLTLSLFILMLSLAQARFTPSTM